MLLRFQKCRAMGEAISKGDMHQANILLSELKVYIYLIRTTYLL